MSVAFRTCRADEVAPLQAFFAAMYSPQYVLSRDDRYLRWQFREGPAEPDDRLALKLALVDGAIAGCIGYIPVEISLGGGVRRGAWAANWMVDDQYRRLGLGPLLLRDLCKQFDVTLALGGNRDAHSLLPRMGWKDFGDLPRYVLVLDPEAAGRLTEAGAIEWPRVSPSGADAGAERVDEFDDDATALWDRVCGDSAGTRRSAAFLSWRYQQHPTFEYRLFERRDGGSLRGFAVYRIEQVQDVARVGRIVELVGEADHLQPLLHGLVADARRDGVAMLDLFCSSPRLRPAMTGEGFLPGEAPPARALPMLFQPIDRSRTGILFMADVRKCPEADGIDDWYVTSADGDQDRPN
jgi:GNAT superfamily N-acetyltransferase